MAQNHTSTAQDLPFLISIFSVPFNCEYQGGSVISRGLFRGDDPLVHPLPLIMLQLGFAVLLTALFRFILRPVNQPRFVAEMVAGILLGPSIFEIMGVGEFYSKFFTFKQIGIWNFLEFLSLSMYEFLVGVQVDVTVVKRSGKLAWIIGIAIFVFPLGLSKAMAVLLGLTQTSLYEKSLLLNLSPLAASISFHVTSLLLDDLNLLNSELGRLALSSSLIGSLCFWIHQIIQGFLLQAQFMHLSFWFSVKTQIIPRILFVLFIVFGLRRFMLWLIKKIPEGKDIKQSHFMIIMFLLFGTALSSEVMGYSAYFGAMVLGLSVPTGPPLGAGIVERLSLFVSLVMVPSYVVSAGHYVDIFMIKTTNLALVQAIFAAAMLFKVGSAMAALRFFKMPTKDAFTLALILNSQGFFDVLFFKRCLAYSQISQEYFTIVTLLTVFNAAITTPLIRHLYDPSQRYINYKRRTIHHLSPEQELRVLACLHEEDDALSVMDILKSSHPARKRPIGVYVLDLMELAGQSQPVFINHQFHKKYRSSMLTRTDRIISYFHQFENNYEEGIKHQHFTAVAPYTSMHDEICMLALEKNASLVIIPFHKLEIQQLKGVKRNVLEKAPCSVGILVNKRIIHWRAHLDKESNTHICVVFLGGPDSREALSLGTRMLENPAAKLTVIRLIAEDDFVSDFLETKFDVGMISGLRSMCEGGEGGGDYSGRIEYREVMVRDGVKTTEILQSLEDEYDLMLVGRRVDEESPMVAGLTVWNSSPELGVVGEILSSTDMKSNAPVLVLQQQSTVEDLLQIKK